MIGLLLLSGTFLLVGFTAVRAVREWRRSDLADQARDDWDTAVTDALRLAAIGRHPVSQRRSVAEFWRSHFPRDRTPLVLRLVKEDQ